MHWILLKRSTRNSISWQLPYKLTYRTLRWFSWILQNFCHRQNVWRVFQNGLEQRIYLPFLETTLHFVLPELAKRNKQMVINLMKVKQALNHYDNFWNFKLQVDYFNFRGNNLLVTIVCWRENATRQNHIIYSTSYKLFLSFSVSYLECDIRTYGMSLITQFWIELQTIAFCRYSVHYFSRRPVKAFGPALVIRLLSAYFPYVWQ